MKKSRMFFASLLACVAFQAHATSFNYCPLRPTGAANPLYKGPAGAGSYITLPAGTHVVLKDRVVHGSQTFCVLDRPVYPFVFHSEGRVFAFDLKNGQEVYTQDGRMWEAESLLQPKGFVVETVYHSTTFSAK